MSEFDHDPSEKGFAETDRIIEEHAKKYPNVGAHQKTRFFDHAPVWRGVIP